MITAPGPGAPAIVWAVYLGADTAPRLAHEWGIARTNANNALRKAVKVGALRVVGDRWADVGETRMGRYHITRRRVVVYASNHHQPEHQEFALALAGLGKGKQ